MKKRDNIFNIDDMLEKDQYSILLFILYKLTNIEEYQCISELIYTLDKSNFYNMIKIFGGQTIRIPTLQELESTTKLMLLYKYNKVDNMDFLEAVDKAELSRKDVNLISDLYSKVCDILSIYNFNNKGV